MFGVVSALLQRKTQEAYHELFRVIVEKCEELFGFAPFPELCIKDFEKGAHNALKEVYETYNKQSFINHVLILSLNDTAPDRPDALVPRPTPYLTQLAGWSVGGSLIM